MNKEMLYNIMHQNISKCIKLNHGYILVWCKSIKNMILVYQRIVGVEICTLLSIALWDDGDEKSDLMFLCNYYFWITA